MAQSFPSLRGLQQEFKSSLCCIVTYMASLEKPPYKILDQNLEVCQVLSKLRKTKEWTLDRRVRK